MSVQSIPNYNVVPRAVWPVEAMLGEGPAWFADDSVLRFVDIKQGMLHRFHPETGDRQSVSLGGQPSFVVPADNGRLLIGSNDQISVTNADGSDPRSLLKVPMPPHNRTNDATVDGEGRLWFGTMDDDESQSTGGLWCLDRGRLTDMGMAAVVTNGPAVSRDGRKAYYVVSGARTIWQLSIGEGPSIVKQEVFVQLTPADGYPDGVVLDSEGCLWVALWDGWSVRRYAPDGTLLQTIEFPCARVTKIAFGGPDLRTAFVTTARVGLDEQQLAEQQLAGALFTFSAPTSGRILPTVRLA